MKILLIANYQSTYGGISKVVLNISDKIKEEGHNTEIFSTKRNFFLRLILIFPLILKVRKYDIIHIHGCSNLGYYPIFLGVIVCKYIFNKKTIVTFHGGSAETFLKRYTSFVRKTLSRVDHITVMSLFFQKIFSQFGIQTSILPNIINISSKSFKEIEFEAPKLVSIRSLDKIYNIIDIIKAFEKIKLEYPDGELRIIGNGPESEYLQAFCREIKIKDVEFAGHIPNDQIPNELIKSNILVSVPSFDNQPMSILEAFSVGVPVISSNIGGIPYLITDFKNGLLVDVNCPEQIYERVKWIITNSDKTRKLVQNATKKLEEFQWECIKQQLYYLYEK